MIRIILVADDPNNAHEIQSRLQRLSYDVVAISASADEVITRANELRSDVILVDVSLKGETDGIEVAQEIKRLRDVPIIFITADTDEATVRRAIAAEPDGFLIMPLNELELRAAIELAINRHGMKAKGRESDRRIHELIESLSEVLFETDMAGNITFVNYAGLKEFGYTKEQVEGGLTLYDLVPPDKQEEIRKTIAQAVIDEPSAWIEVLGLRRDGSTFPASVRASLIVREGVPTGMRGIARNVTEQKLAEQQREDSERQLRELTDSIPEIVFETDIGGAFTFLNHLGLESLGYTEADLNKQLTFEDLIIPADHARARENFRKRLGGTAAVWAEYTAQRKDGSTFPLSIRTTAVISDGVVIGARGIAVDITERKRAEEQLRAASLYARSLIEASLDPLVTINAAGKITDVNTATEEVTGLSRHELIGSDFSSYFTEPKKANAGYRQVFTDGFVRDYPLAIRHKSGKVADVLYNATVYRNEADEIQGVFAAARDITDRKRAEKALREQDEMLRLIFNASDDVIFLADTAGVVLTANEGLAHRFGVKPDELVDLSIFAHAPDDVAEKRRAFFEQAIAKKLPVHWQDERDGRYLENALYPIVTAQGEITKVVVFSRDVTERERAEQKLRESERQVREFAQMLPELAFEIDTEGKLTFVNDGVIAALGISREKLTQKTVLSFIAPEDRQRAQEGVQRILRGERAMVRGIEYNGVRADGSTFPLLISTTAIRRNDATVGIRGVAVDITEQKRAAQKLEESERRIREVTDALPVVVYEADATGRITFVNATASDMFGYTKEELEAGMSLFQLVTDADKKRALTLHRRRLSGEDMGRIEYIGLRKDGSTCPISVRAVSIRRHNEVVGVRGIVVDITERKQAEERMKEYTRTIEILNQIVTAGNRATDVQSFAKTVTDSTLKLLHFDIGTIHLYDFNTRRANLCYAAGFPDIAFEAINGISLDEALYKRVLVEGEPIFVDGNEALRVPHAVELGLKSLAVVPLYSYDKRIGAFNVGSFTPNTLSQAEKELLIAIGNEVGVVIAKLQADEALKESERRIREVTDALPVVVYETDETGRFTFVNATASDMFGYTKEELEAGMSIFQLIIPTDRERAHTVFHRRVGGEDVGRIEYTGLRKDGGMFPILLRAVQMKRDDAVIGVRGVIVDFTEQKQTEQALAQESAINSAIARLFTPLIAPTSTLEGIALAILDEAKGLTGSVTGFVGLIDPANRDMIGFGHTQMMLEECAISEEKRQIRFPIGPDGSYPALWGHALTSKKGFYTNAPATHPASRGTPDGHTPLTQLLAAPALVVEDVVGQIVLANPGRDYTERDLEAIERLADVYALAVVRTQEENAIEEALTERETLLKEIHHRVKNNMQIISSLLSLQAAQTAEPEMIEMLNESQRRIRSMALIHEKLYRSGSLAKIDFGDYVESMVDDLLRMYHIAEGEITITTDIENVQLNVDTAIPCALIVTELVSNCLKHAFPDGRTGEATIALHRINGTYELIVADNGVGPPPDLDVRATDTLGLQLVTGLVNQLNGTITLDRTKGTTFIITFKPAGAHIRENRAE